MTSQSTWRKPEQVKGECDITDYNSLIVNCKCNTVNELNEEISPVSQGPLSLSGRIFISYLNHKYNIEMMSSVIF